MKQDYFLMLQLNQTPLQILQLRLGASHLSGLTGICEFYFFISQSVNVNTHSFQPDETNITLSEFSVL